MTTQGILLSVALSGVLLAACAENGLPTTDAVVRSDSAGVSIVFNNTVQLTSACQIGDEPTLSIGVADGEEPYMFYRIFGAVTLGDGRIAIANQGSQEVRLFDSDGTYRGSMGRKGEGPGEFNRMFHLWRVRGNELWVGDTMPWSYEVFDTDGNFLRQVTPTPRYDLTPQRFGVLTDGRSIHAVTQGELRDFNRVMLAFMLHDSDGALVDTLFTIPDGRWGSVDTDDFPITVYPVFGTFTEFDVRKNRIVIGAGGKPEISVRNADRDFDAELVIRWTTPDRSISQADIDEQYAEVRTRYADQSDGMNRQLLAAMTHPGRPVADRKPAFTAVKLGVDESIWVEQFEAEGETDGSNWMRFGPDGVFTCHLSLPRDLTVYEFGSDYVLGKLVDESGTERIVVYAFQTASVVSANNSGAELRRK